jgi:DNA-3-methyladenine glycosylase I
LNKREAFAEAFDNFDPAVIVNYSEDKVAELQLNKGIVRNKLKIASSITNARAFLEVQSREGSFNNFIWQFTGGATKKNSWTNIRQVPASTTESDAMSKELKRLGFKFVGSTICYAFMQAAGMVNDHLISCYRYEEVGEY